MSNWARLFVSACVLIAALTGAAVDGAGEEKSLEQQVNELKAKLEELQKHPDTIDPKLIEALRPLNTILDQLDTPDISVVAKAARLLADTLVRFKPGDAALTEPNVRALLDLARKTIEDTEKDSELLRLEARTTRLTAALAAFKGELKPPLLAAVTALNQAISPRLDRSVRIHIVHARYGDVRFPNDKGRTCDATGYFRVGCERQMKCLIPDPGTAEAICGYDPAPFAEDRDRGAVVIYRCISTTDAGWQGLASAASAATDFVDPKIRAKYRRTARPNSEHQVQLQGKAAFLCDQPAVLQGGAGTPKGG